MSDSRDWHEYQERIEDHDYAIINNAVALIRSHCKPHHHWVCDRLLEVRHRAACAETYLAWHLRHEAEGDTDAL